MPRALPMPGFDERPLSAAALSELRGALEALARALVAAHRACDDGGRGDGGTNCRVGGGGGGGGGRSGGGDPAGDAATRYFATTLFDNRRSGARTPWAETFRRTLGELLELSSGNWDRGSAGGKPLRPTLPNERALFLLTPCGDAGSAGAAAACAQAYASHCARASPAECVSLYVVDTALLGPLGCSSVAAAGACRDALSDALGCVLAAHGDGRAGGVVPVEDVLCDGAWPAACGIGAHVLRAAEPFPRRGTAAVRRCRILLPAGGRAAGSAADAGGLARCEYRELCAVELTHASSRADAPPRRDVPVGGDLVLMGTLLNSMDVVAGLAGADASHVAVMCADGPSAARVGWAGLMAYLPSSGAVCVAALVVPCGESATVSLVLLRPLSLTCALLDRVAAAPARTIPLWAPRVRCVEVTPAAEAGACALLRSLDSSPAALSFSGEWFSRGESNRAGAVVAVGYTDTISLAQLMDARPLALGLPLVDCGPVAAAAGGLGGDASAAAPAGAGPRDADFDVEDLRRRLDRAIGAESPAADLASVLGAGPVAPPPPLLLLGPAAGVSSRIGTGGARPPLLRQYSSSTPRASSEAALGDVLAKLDAEFDRAVAMPASDVAAFVQCVARAAAAAVAAA